jgi:hypothetical protein
MDTHLFPAKRSIVNPYTNQIYSLHKQQTEAVTVLRFKRSNEIESRVRNLSSYVYNRGYFFMVFLDTLLSWGILCDKSVIYTIS